MLLIIEISLRTTLAFTSDCVQSQVATSTRTTKKEAAEDKCQNCKNELRNPSCSQGDLTQKPQLFFVAQKNINLPTCFLMKEHEMNEEEPYLKGDKC